MHYYAMVLILLNFVFAKEKKFTIAGHIFNKAESVNVLLKEYNTVQNIQTVLDTIFINDGGDFKASFGYQPGIYQIDFDGIEKVNFAIEAGQYVNIDVTVPSNKQEQPEIQLSGSPDAIMVFDYDKKQKAAYKKWLNPVRRNIRLAKEAGQTQRISQLSDLEKKNLIIYKNELAQYSKEKMTHSIALFYAAVRLDPELHLEYMKEIAQYFNKTRPELTLTQLFNEKISRISNLSIGNYAPEISISEQDGSPVKLTDYRGKYVLLDFWAAWCNPCRIENLNYARLYSKYKNNGFEIFAVSVDTSQKLWHAASVKDNVSWINVSDFNGWATSSALTYNVSAIPNNFLLDKTGKIIARNIRGKDLQSKLSELLD
jgi:peroxiredoxin